MSAVVSRLPIGLFGSVMGLTGLSLGWRLAHARFGAPMSIAVAIGVVAVIAFIAITLGYSLKIATAPDAVRNEFRHPVAGNLFGTFIISLLLLPMIVAPYGLTVARVVWSTGVVAMMAFAMVIIDRWMGRGRQIDDASPAWIVPVVGLLDVPLAAPAVQLPALQGLMVLSLAVGLFFAVPLFTVIFARLIFRPPLPAALQPTLMIVLAPFAVGMSAYVTVVGRMDLFAQALYGLTLFMLCVLLGRLRFVARCCPFTLSWWAVSFPLAAAAVASLHVADSFPNPMNDAVAWVLLSLASVVIAWLSFRSLVGIATGELAELKG